MPNRNLTTDELKQANDLLANIRKNLKGLSGRDAALEFAYRRKIAKELQYDERGKPAKRKLLKSRKWREQNRQCAECKKEIEVAYSELDRKEAIKGYTAENTELVCAACHHKRQAARGYA